MEGIRLTQSHRTDRQFRMRHVGGGDEAQQGRALAALPEEPTSVPSTHVR